MVWSLASRPGGNATTRRPPASRPVLSAAVSQAGLIEKLDAVDFERCAHSLEFAGLHARNTVASLRARNGRLRYPAPLRQLSHGPIEKAAGSADLRARYV